MTDGQTATVSSDELRLRLYELMHDKLETERASRMTRATRGGLLIALVFGYAAFSGDLRFIALTPILYGVVAMDVLRSTVKLLYLNRHLVRIEDELGEREPLYDWVTRNGTFGDVPRIEVSEFDLNEIPAIALIVSIVAGYAALIVLAVRTWTLPVGPTQRALAPPVPLEFLLFGYAVLTVFLVVISAVGYLHVQRLTQAVESRHRT